MKSLLPMCGVHTVENEEEIKWVEWVREREREKQTKQAKQKHKTNMHNKISFIIKFMFGKLCSVLSTIFYSLCINVCGF